MKGNYDNVAPFYDLLTRFFFGKAVINANNFLTQQIPANSNILIVGGGAGIILEQIVAIHSTGLQITYIELSSKMLAIAKKRNTGKNKIIFINSAIQIADLSQTFDVVITPFLFDNFLQATADEVFHKLNACLKPGGLWLFADFTVQDKRQYWQKPMLKLMYWFFRLTCNIESRTLPDISLLFANENYSIASNKRFYKDFITATVFTKDK